ncbi:recombination mediator RecR [Patescibacteria group bacterium]
MYSPSIQKLIKIFSKFPTVGPRTAARFVFYLMRLSKEEIDNITKSINELKEKVKICSFCFNSFEDEGNLCKICKDNSRDKTLLCIVEKEIDLVPLENTKKYLGRYFILGGTISSFKKTDVEKLRTKELKQKINANPEIKEIIIALNPTIEGQTTARYLEKLLRPLGKKITRLGQGLPMGGEIEYSDEETIEKALEGRK